MSEEKQLAIIKGVQCGVGDYGKFALWFSTNIDECLGALQVFHGAAVAELVESYGVRDIRQLEGKPCWVKCTGNAIEWVGKADI